MALPSARPRLPVRCSPRYVTIARTDALAIRSATETLSLVHACVAATAACFDVTPWPKGERSFARLGFDWGDRTGEITVRCLPFSASLGRVFSLLWNVSWI